MNSKNGLRDLIVTLFATMLLTVAGFAFAGEPVGHVLMVTGDAVRVDAEGNSSALGDKQPVFEGDRLQTAESGMLQIKMVDNALLVLQAKTAVVIARYQYDAESPENSAARIDLVKGRARSVTGELGEGNHDAFRLNTPIAAIGIRGTDFETTTTDELTRVRLNSGAIVFAPLGENCAVADLGPCATDSSLLLTEEMGTPVAELKASDTSPRLLELPEFDDDQSGMRVEEEQVSIEDNADKVVRQFDDGRPDPVDPGFTPVEVPANWDDQIHWGRWESATYLDEGTTVGELVAEDKEILFRNDLFALFRDEFLSLDKGQASFGLQAAQAGILEAGTYTPVVLADGSLMIDFDDRFFETGLQFVGGSVDGLTLTASGSVDFQGLLRSEDGNMWVRGGLADDNSQVGYLFRHQLDDTSNIQGATQWQRH